MGANLRLPNINGPTEKEQLLQIKTYLYQLIGDLQFALNNGAASHASTQKGNSGFRDITTMNANTVFAALKPLIIKSADITNSISNKLAEKYVAQSDFDSYKSQLSGKLTSIKQDIDNDINGLADRLTVTENDLIYTYYFLYEQITELAANIEHGEGEGWTYKKWKSGSYEMFGTFEVTPNACYQRQTLYQSNYIEIKPPFEITSGYVSGNDTGLHYIINGGISNNGNIIVGIISDTPIDITSPIEIQLRVVGNYAQPTEDMKND